MLENQIYFWFEASVASSFPKSSIGRRIYFALFHIDLHGTFYPYSYTHSPFCHLYVFLGPSAPMCFL
jgi:hypothetical protein